MNPTPDESIVKAARVSSAVGAGKLRRFRHLQQDDGRSLLVAVDHAAYMGTGPTDAAVAAIAAGRPDGVLATWHLARTHASALAPIGLVLRLDGGTSELVERSDRDMTSLLYRAEEAVALGADAVILLVFPGAPDEHASLHRLARVCTECELLGVPVVAEVIPGGWAQAVPWTPEIVSRGARIAVELGADIIKTVCPGSPADFKLVADTCPAPVVVLGGPKMPTEDDAVDFARGVVAAGAAGIAFGRNVWGSSDPGALIGRLHEAVHNTER